jgi:hypothetical protein
MDRMRILGAMANGVGFVCAHCENFWWSVDRGFTECRPAVEGRLCGGPFIGHAFPEYKGPLGKQLSSYCFVCGDKSSKVAMASKGSSAGLMVGICDKHYPMLDDVGLQGEKPRFLSGKKIDVRSG